MATIQRTETRCDLCNYGGAYSAPDDFVQRDGFDLCRWCAQPDRRAWIETGGHRATFDGDTWTCSCGASHESTLIQLRFSLAVLDAVPFLPNATAFIHLERRV